ncbi:MAG TPA: ATP-binding protein [Gaiellaceae bacterium]|nr:ATP-binding protein [Gaiellaceae bacterium]
MEPLRLVFDLDPALLRRARQELARWLNASGVAPPQADDLVLAVHEALANAVEYGRRGTQVTLRGRADAEGVTLVVSNRGPWKRQREDRGRGRGLTVMRSLATECDVRVGREATTVLIRKAVRLGAPLLTRGGQDGERGGDGAGPAGVG